MDASWDALLCQKICSFFLSLWGKGAKTRSTIHTRQRVIGISISSEIVFELLGNEIEATLRFCVFCFFFSRQGDTYLKRLSSAKSNFISVTKTSEQHERAVFEK